MLTILITAITFFVLGHFFGILIIKGINNMLGRPYMTTVFTGEKEGSMSINAMFNNLFIYELDRQYSQIPSDMYDPMADDNEKIAIYLYDVLSNIADNYLPEKPQYMIDDIAANVPSMGGNGGKTVRQVVDLSDVSSKTVSNNGIDLEQG